MASLFPLPEPVVDSFSLTDFQAYAAHRGTGVGSFAAFRAEKTLARYYDDAYSRYDAQFHV